MSDSENSTDNKTLDITLKLSQITTEEEFRDLAKDLLALVSSSPYENVQTAWNAKDHSFHIYAEVSEENTEALEVLVSAVQRFSENVDDDLKPLRDERFGVFSWSGYGSWETEVEVSDDLTFNLLIEAEEPGDDVTASLTRARTIVANLSLEDNRWRAAAADNLLDNYNRNWNEGVAIDREAFMGKLTLSMLRIGQDGCYSAWYFQDGMFTDHVVAVYISAEGSVKSASVEG
jgi:hypothetical protein